MKSLENFRHIVEEEKSDYSKFDTLVRAGLANKAQMQRIHKILDKMHEERPQFNNADKMILQNLFNKMVDLISNNKQINMQARRAVKESLDEAAVVVDTADYKMSPSGKKVRAHKLKVGERVSEEYIAIEAEDLNEASNMPLEPPVVLMLKRKAVRLYPDGQKVALYYNKQLDKLFSVPYGLDSVVQAEEVQIEESVMNTLHKIVKEKQAQPVKFASGHSRKVDGYTASAITQVHNALNDANKKKFSDLVHKSPEHFEKAAAFAFKHAK
jgi:hypothetical protein